MNLSLAITQQPSFIASKTFIEKILPHELEQLIASDCLKDKWDFSIYSHKEAANHYVNEREQMKSYLALFRKNVEGVQIKYMKARHKWGRVFVPKSLGLTSFSRYTRNTLIRGRYYDFDLKNCQPEILRNLCIKNNVPCKTIIKYCKEREKIIAEIIAASNNTATREQVKWLMIRLSFCGLFDNWLEEFEIPPFPEPVIVKQYSKEIKKIAQHIADKNPEMYKTIERKKKEEGGKNIIGSFLSTYLQEFELRIIDNVLQFLCENTNICSTDIPNHFIATYEFDGIKLLKANCDAYVVRDQEGDIVDRGVDAVLKLFNHTLKEAGLDMLFEIKPITEFYDIVFEPPKVLVVVDKKQIEKEKKEREKEEKIRNLKELADKQSEEKVSAYTKFKREFEKTHFKIVSKGVYFELVENPTTLESKFIIRSRKQLKDSFEHLSCSLNEKGKPASFIDDWVSDPNMHNYLDADVFPNPDKCPPNVYNMWIPFRMEKYTGEYTPDIVGRDFILNHIKILCNHEQEINKYMIEWLAQMIQFPEHKSTCPIFVSEEGAGKGSFIELMKQILGHRKVLVTAEPDKHVWGQFNNLMSDAYFVVLDELSKSVTMKANEVIKNLITDTTMHINNKGISCYEIQSFHRYMSMTNKSDAGILTTKGDRRKLIIRSSDELIGNEDYFNKFYAYLENENALRTFYDYLKNMKDIKVKLNQPPVTEYQEILKELSTNPIELWIDSHALYIENNYRKEGHVLQKDDAYSLDAAGNIIWSVLPKTQYDSFVKWRDSCGFNYETNTTKLGVNIKLLNSPFITKGKRSSGGSSTYRDFNLTLIAKKAGFIKE